jgi:TRAP-type C4-dicarboxylate transport system substrate-binding protein
VTGPGWYFTSKINEVTKYWLWKPVGIGANLTLMKEEKWNKLPSDVKAVWTEMMTETKYRFLEDVEKQIPDTRAHFPKLGIEVYSLDPAEEARWDAIFNQYVEEWIADREAKGYPARETVEAVKQIVNRFAE